MERYRPPHEPARATPRAEGTSISTALKLTAVLGAAVSLLGLPLATLLSIAPQPFPRATDKPVVSDPASAGAQDPGAGRPSFSLPAVDGGGFPGNDGYLYSVPIASVPQAPTQAIPPLVLTAYQRATQALASRMPQCHLTWPVLAAIGKVESDHAGGGELQPDGTAVVPILGPELNGTHGNPAVRDTDRGALDGDAVWDRAVGPMQILPSVWRQWAATDRPGGAPDPQNVFDATLTAGELLCTAGGDLRTASGLQRAVSAYHRSPGYVQAVLAWAALYATESLALPFPGAAGPPSWSVVPPSAFSSTAALPTASASDASRPSAPATTAAATAGTTAHGPAGRGTPPPASGAAGPPHGRNPRHASPSGPCACRKRTADTDRPPP